MKLSKNELIYLLRGVGTEWGSIEDAFRAEHVIDALENGTLEIEGYVREDHLRDATKMADEWTKFDPDDPNTHPPCSAPVIREPAFYLVRIYGQTQIAEWDNDYVAFLIDDHEAITHWRPPPPPPVETEAKK